MIVGFDVSQTGSLKAGCGYFADGLVRGLAALDETTQYLLYPTFGGDFWDDQWPRSTVHLRRPNVRRSLGHRTLAELRRFWDEEPADLELQLGQPDIVHSNNFFCPTGLRRARLVYTLHDVAFVHHPEWTTEENRVACFTGVFRASVGADHIIANSRATRDDFLQVFPHVAPERISVVHPASRFTPGATVGNRPAALAGMAPGQFWLSVATLEPRKNHARLLRAYARYVATSPAEALPLVLAGGRGWLMDDFQATIDVLGLGRNVLLLGYVPDDELAWLYEHCFAFVYVSTFEGFGMPVLEAMSLGAAIVSSDATSLPEVVGDAGLLVDPFDEPAIASALTRLGSDEALRRNLQLEARQQASHFSWRHSAEQVRDIYRELPPRAAQP
ncbi:MAG: glycosyltransferase family 4 protein [Chloroflexi bacterium]|nr:glycosyltransferase family 4 protein [Chloroflexota bacterium]